MLEWFNKLQPAQATITAAVFGAIVTILIALITVGIKDFLFPLLAERRAAKRKRRDTFRLYSNPIIMAATSLLFRLKEILSSRGQFLLNNSPKNEFTEYKYLSTLYRFTSLLGWIRAASLEFSLIELDNKGQYKSIMSSLALFEQKLADGQDVELSVLRDLARLWKLNISGLPEAQKASLGASLENVADEYCFEAKVESVNMLSLAKQEALAIQLNRIIAESAKIQPSPATQVTPTVPEFSKELSRTLGLIYRDWQAAIGDLMIRRTEKGDRKYEVIGFREFEAMYMATDNEKEKWLKRANKLFANLDVRVEDRFDGRTKQLKEIYAATYQILKAFSKIKVANVELAADVLKKLSPRIA